MRVDKGMEMGGGMCSGEAHRAGKRRNTVVVLRGSGEQLLRPRGTRERETRGKWKRTSGAIYRNNNGKD